ncbi:MAG: hypothetical protein J2P21_06460 [Chloracidobacterium sp.]|nr:hypothetical protein [Chloracidobacterium sp.]
MLWTSSVFPRIHRYPYGKEKCDEDLCQCNCGYECESEVRDGRNTPLCWRCYRNVVAVAVKVLPAPGVIMPPVLFLNQAGKHTESAPRPQNG